jgi:hypothetical protein
MVPNIEKKKKKKREGRIVSSLSLSFQHVLECFSSKFSWLLPPPNPWSKQKKTKGEVLQLPWVLLKLHGLPCIFNIYSSLPVFYTLHKLQSLFS